MRTAARQPQQQAAGRGRWPLQKGRVQWPLQDGDWQPATWKERTQRARAIRYNELERPLHQLPLMAAMRRRPQAVCLLRFPDQLHCQGKRRTRRGASIGICGSSSCAGNVNVLLLKLRSSHSPVNYLSRVLCMDSGGAGAAVVGYNFVASPGLTWKCSGSAQSI